MIPISGAPQVPYPKATGLACRSLVTYGTESDPQLYHANRAGPTATNDFMGLASACLQGNKLRLYTIQFLGLIQMLSILAEAASFSLLELAKCLILAT